MEKRKSEEKKTVKLIKPKETNPPWTTRDQSLTETRCLKQDPPKKKKS